MGDLTAAELHTPTEWCLIEGVEILDPDGWRGVNGRPWADAITLAEFRKRLATCTQRRVPPRGICKCPGFLCSCHHGDTQPAVEHHVGTLDLSGEGNRGEVASPISDDAVGTFSEAYLMEILSRVSTASLPSSAAVRAGLEAAYPAIREQVAEEIAVALEAVPAEVYPEDFFPVDGTSVDCQSARVMRFAYPAAARMARDIGKQGEDATAPGSAGGASGRTGLSASPSDPQAGKAGRSESGGSE